MVKYANRTYLVTHAAATSNLEKHSLVQVFLGSRTAGGAKGAVGLKEVLTDYPPNLVTECGCVLLLLTSLEGCVEIQEETSVEMDDPRANGIKPKRKPRKPLTEAGDGLPPHLEPYKELAVKPNDSVFAGGKDDADKLVPSLLYSGVPNALEAVLRVLMGGAKKYSAHSWQHVEDGINRYWEAAGRHKMDIDKHGLRAVNMKDFGLLDLDHMIINLLFVRELMFLEDQAKK